MTLISGISRRVVPEAIDIYTDGACIDNPGPGGFAGIIMLGGTRHVIEGGSPETTNNRMEMQAVIESLLALDRMPQSRGAGISVYSDSRYLVDALNQRWYEKWQRNGWRTAKKQRVKNQDLWREILHLIQGRNVTFNWIRGHDNHFMNELCDRLSNRQARKAAGETAPFVTSSIP